METDKSGSRQAALERQKDDSQGMHLKEASSRF